MILRDWRTLDASVVEACYAAERDYARGVLCWDTEWAWSTVEQARVTWGLPGYVAFDAAGTVQGWTYYFADAAAVQVGALVSATPAVTGLLLDAVIAAARAAGTARVTGFLVERAAGLRDELLTRGCTLNPHLYLSAQPSMLASPAEPTPLDDWRDGDMYAAAALLRESYAPEACAHFVANGTMEEWLRYVRSLVQQQGCGTFDPTASRVARDVRGLTAVVIVSAISASAAHIVQIAVRPEARGRGLARELLRDAARRVARSRSALTLIVSEGNAGARRLYGREGFGRRARYMAATLALRHDAGRGAVGAGGRDAGVTPASAPRAGDRG